VHAERRSEGDLMERTQTSCSWPLRGPDGQFHCQAVAIFDTAGLPKSLLAAEDLPPRFESRADGSGATKIGAASKARKLAMAGLRQILDEKRIHWTA
jgi:hypothetical protein